MKYVKLITKCILVNANLLCTSIIVEASDIPSGDSCPCKCGPNNPWRWD